MYLPVKERVKLSLQKRLSTITKANGYNMDVDAVIRTRELPTRPSNNCVIWMMPLPATPLFDHQTTDREYVNQPMELWFYEQNTEDIDTRYEYFVGDIKMCLQNDIQDIFHPNPHQTQIYLLYKKDTPLYDTFGNGVVGGFVLFDVRYWNSINHQGLWDDVEDVLVDPENLLVKI